MADNILESYLVKLGAVTDANSFNKFNATLKDSGKVFGDFSFGTIANFGKMEVAIVGMFAAVGAGLIGLADKTAMADQSYRLMGLRMLMGKDSARAMSMATDALGASLDEIAYDPELNRRFQYLYEQEIKLGKTLGSGFDRNMISIRDLRTEYKFFGDELTVLTMGSVSKLFEKIGFGSGDALNDLDHLTTWFMTNIPMWSDEIATDLVPVWKDFVGISKEAGSVIWSFASGFTNVVGILKGDDSLTTQTVNFRQFASAVEDTVGWLDKFVHAAMLVTKAAINTGDAVAYGMKGFRDLLPDFTLYVDKNGKYTPDDLWHRRKSEHGDTESSRSHILDAGKNLGSAFDTLFTDQNPQTPQATPTSGDFASLMREAGTKYGIDPNLIAAIVHRESGGNPGVISHTGAKGLMQLEPATAAQFGVTNPFNPEQSINGGAAFLQQLSKHYHGNGEDTLAAYNWGQGNEDSYLKTGHGLITKSNPTGDMPTETKNYIRNVMRDYKAYSEGGAGGVTINSLTINVPPTATHPDEIKRYITDSMVDYTAKVNQRTMSQTAAGAYF